MRPDQCRRLYRLECFYPVFDRFYCRKFLGVLMRLFQESSLSSRISLPYCSLRCLSEAAERRRKRATGRKKKLSQSQQPEQDRVTVIKEVPQKSLPVVAEKQKAVKAFLVTQASTTPAAPIVAPTSSSFYQNATGATTIKPRVVPVNMKKPISSKTGLLSPPQHSLRHLSCSILFQPLR